MSRRKNVLLTTFGVLVSVMVGVVSASAQRNEASAAAFEAMLPVLHHPRCMNCHSAGDFPRQGDDSHPHAMNVRRGPKGVA